MLRGTHSRVLLFAVCACLLGTSAFGEDIAKRRARTITAPASLRVDIGLIQIPVTVTDSFGGPVPDLPRDSFKLYEDAVEQSIRYFSFEDAPISLGVVFDASRSMASRIDPSRDAVSQFLRTTSPGDEFFLVEFNDAPRMVCSFTPDATEIEKSLTGIQPRNWTALFDAVYLAVHQMKRARNPRRALLILSDGGDNNSRYTESEMRRMVREADVVIYSIALGGGILNQHARMLRNLSEETGGRSYQVEDLDKLPEAVEKISDAIRSQYVLGYVSAAPRTDGLYRKIEVRVNPTPEAGRVRASWRRGYYSPLQ
jgi:VWFA-related protein